jgi:hypothetical protein
MNIDNLQAQISSYKNLVNSLKTSENRQTFQLNKNSFSIPNRIYENDIDAVFKNLDSITKSCILTRHTDGFIREQNLKIIINNANYFTIPFVILLAGEYVYPIIEYIEENLDEDSLSKIISFFEENLDFYKTFKSRIVSYWSCYYRLDYPIFKDYVGYKIIERIENINTSLKSITHINNIIENK